MSASTQIESREFTSGNNTQFVRSGKRDNTSQSSIPDVSAASRLGLMFSVAQEQLKTGQLEEARKTVSAIHEFLETQDKLFTTFVAGAHKHLASLQANYTDATSGPISSAITRFSGQQDVLKTQIADQQAFVGVADQHSNLSQFALQQSRNQTQLATSADNLEAKKLHLTQALNMLGGTLLTEFKAYSRDVYAQGQSQAADAHQSLAAKYEQYESNGEIVRKVGMGAAVLGTFYAAPVELGVVGAGLAATAVAAGYEALTNGIQAIRNTSLGNKTAPEAIQEFVDKTQEGIGHAATVAGALTTAGGIATIIEGGAGAAPLLLQTVGRGSVLVPALSVPAAGVGQVATGVGLMGGGMHLARTIDEQKADLQDILDVELVKPAATQDLRKITSLTQSIGNLARSVPPPAAKVSFVDALKANPGMWTLIGATSALVFEQVIEGFMFRGWWKTLAESHVAEKTISLREQETRKETALADKAVQDAEAAKALREKAKWEAQKEENLAAVSETERILEQPARIANIKTEQQGLLNEQTILAMNQGIPPEPKPDGTGIILRQPQITAVTAPDGTVTYSSNGPLTATLATTLADANAKMADQRLKVKELLVAIQLGKLRGAEAERAVAELRVAIQQFGMAGDFMKAFKDTIGYLPEGMGRMLGMTTKDLGGKIIGSSPSDALKTTPEGQSLAPPNPAWKQR